ncbi:MAG: Holliday junction branch migration protein RuvA [bacterium]
MIAALKGTILSLNDTTLIMDVNGVGYQVEVLESALSRLFVNLENVLLYTYMVVREDVMQLYGFIEERERKLFKLMLSVKGIGPKGAHKILCKIAVDDFCSFVVQGDSRALSRLPGIGKKGAEQIVLDLEKKITSISSGSLVRSIGNQEITKPAGKEAIKALIALGYKAGNAEQAVSNANEKVTLVLELSRIVFGHPEVIISNQSNKNIPILDKEGYIRHEYVQDVEGKTTKIRKNNKPM